MKLTVVPINPKMTYANIPVGNVFTFAGYDLCHIRGRAGHFCISNGVFYKNDMVNQLDKVVDHGPFVNFNTFPVSPTRRMVSPIKLPYDSVVKADDGSLWIVVFENSAASDFKSLLKLGDSGRRSYDVLTLMEHVGTLKVDLS